MAERLPVAVDAMGGDDAPHSIIEGSLIAKNEFGIDVVLVGDTEQLAEAEDLPIIHASEVIEMGAEPATAVRTLKDSSMVRAAEAVRDGKASCVLSAGNTGAAMAASLLRLGRIKGVSRPAIAIPFPVLGSTPTTVLDVGANAQCQPDWLVQFALMGLVYCRSKFNIEEPKVAILTIGEEAGKGNTLVKESSKLLESVDWKAFGADYIGNVEGNDLLTGVADVVVCDGFTGNVVLKSLEGVFELFESSITSVLGEIENSSDAIDSVRPVFGELDPVNVGTGMLLGVKGVSMIAHGSSSPIAIANAIKNASIIVEMDLVEKIKTGLLPS